MPPREIRRRLLERIVRRIRGENSPFGPRPREIVFGLQAMDVWMSALEQVPFDVEQWQSKDHSAGHARETAQPTFEGSKFAASYLRPLGRELPGAASCLNDAASEYERIVELLAPAMEATGPASYAAIMGDPSRQRAHSEQVLQPIRRCLASIAEHCQKALTIA